MARIEALTYHKGCWKRPKKESTNLLEAHYDLDVGTAFNLNVETETTDTLVNDHMFDLIHVAWFNIYTKRIFPIAISVN